MRKSKYTDSKNMAAAKRVEAGFSVPNNPAAVSSFHLLKLKRIRRQICPIRQDPRSDDFHHIEMFYN